MTKTNVDPPKSEPVDFMFVGLPGTRVGSLNNQSKTLTKKDMSLSTSFKTTLNYVKIMFEIYPIIVRNK